MSLFITQGYLVLPLDTGLDLSGAANPKILYTTPGGRKGEWVGTIVGENIEYQLANNSIVVLGTWRFQAFCTIGGLNAFGDIIEITFDKPLNL